MSIVYSRTVGLSTFDNITFPRGHSKQAFNFMLINSRKIPGCQTNSKLFFQADVSSKKQMNKFDFTNCRLVFVRFLEESEDTKKTFRNQLTLTVVKTACTSHE